MENADIERRLRGREIARLGRITKLGETWLVPSQTAGASYRVDADAESCTCEDWALSGESGPLCKHMWAVLYQRGLVSLPEDEAVVELRRPTYSQDWPSYNRAQCDEFQLGSRLLSELLQGIVEPAHIGRGPKPILVKDRILAMITKVRSTMSARRCDPTIRSLLDVGQISRPPRPSTLHEAFGDEMITRILHRLVVETSLPLRQLDTKYAIDSTGFTCATHRRWVEARTGKRSSMSEWVKGHFVVGVNTHSVVAVSVTAGSSADGPELIPLLKQTVDAGKVEEFLADKAYLSEANLAAIDEVGAAGYIPFKSNSRGDRGSDLWRRGYAAFMFDNPTWRRHYHLRSNAESTFSSLKRTLGGNLRSKKFRPQVNEVLCKTIAHNIARLVHAIHRHGLETKFRPFEAA